MLARKSILIVEDNCFVALDLALAVEELDGHVVGPAASVDEALSLLATQPIAGAVLDCQLADRDVTPIVMQLVERGVPLVLHSGTGLPPELAELHPDLPVVVKPLKPTTILNLLVEQINARAVPPSSITPNPN